MVKRYGFRGTLAIKYKIDFWNNPITASVLGWNQVVLNQSQQLGYLNSKLMLSWDCPFKGTRTGSQDNSTLIRHHGYKHRDDPRSLHPNRAGSRTWSTVAGLPASRLRGHSQECVWCLLWEIIWSLGGYLRQISEEMEVHKHKVRKQGSVCKGSYGIRFVTAIVRNGRGSYRIRFVCRMFVTEKVRM